MNILKIYIGKYERGCDTLSVSEKRQTLQKMRTVLAITIEREWKEEREREGDRESGRERETERVRERVRERVSRRKKDSES